MGFPKQVLQKCPACGEPRLTVMRSRSVGDNVRRRKECTSCGHRVTTYEVSADFYLLAQRNEAIIRNINEMLGGGEVVLGNKLTTKCADCSHNLEGACSFEFPEYDTPDSVDCIHYVQKETV